MPDDILSVDSLPPWNARAILLVDLDAFFASVEQLDHPEWRGKPVIVGGDAGKRGVVSTASYEARKFGVHSAMPSAQAQRLCPDAIWTVGNYPRYIEMSKMVMDILLDESPHLQQVSIDEAFLDVTPGRFVGEHPVVIARRIQQRIDELGITCSVGVGTNKTVAKIASDQDKPHGITVVFPGSEASFLGPLPLRAMSGIGPRSAEKLEKAGIRTLGDIVNADEGILRAVFGINSTMMRERCAGTEQAPVETERDVKSVSNESTFSADLSDSDEIHAAISMIAAKVGRRLRRKMLTGRTVTLKLRYTDLSARTAQRSLGHRTDDEDEIAEVAKELLPMIWSDGMAVRLVGVGVSGFEETEDKGAFEQLSLFPNFDEGRPSEANDAFSGRLHEATDTVKNRFGEDAVRFGRELRFEGRDTGTVAQRKDDYKDPLFSP